jgi:serine O-acetyltransferase
MTSIESSPVPPEISREELFRSLHGKNPPFFRALLADARAARAESGAGGKDRSGPRTLLDAIRLIWTTDAFGALAIYRLRARLKGLRVPILPRILHQLSIMSGKVMIGDPVVIEPGLNLPGGQVVIDGLTEMEGGITIGPFVTIGLVGGSVDGPIIREGARIESGARVLGRVVIGAGARVVANSVVLQDVPPGGTAAGIPARLLTPEPGGATGPAEPSKPPGTVRG